MLIIIFSFIAISYVDLLPNIHTTINVPKNKELITKEKSIKIGEEFYRIFSRTLTYCGVINGTLIITHYNPSQGLSGVIYIMYFSIKSIPIKLYSIIERYSSFSARNLTIIGYNENTNEIIIRQEWIKEN